MPGVPRARCRAATPAGAAISRRTARPRASYLLQRIERALPFGVHGFHQALGRVRGQRSMRRVAQRQPGGDLAQRRTGRACRPGARPAPAACPRPRVQCRNTLPPGQRWPSAGLELQAAGSRTRSRRPGACRRGGPRPSARPAAAAAARACVLTSASTMSAAPPVSWPARDVGPGPHRAVALADFDAEVGIAPQLRHIDAGEVAVQLAVPFLPVAMARGQQGLAKQAAQAESLAPFAAAAWRPAAARGGARRCASRSRPAPARAAARRASRRSSAPCRCG